MAVRGIVLGTVCQKTYTYQVLLKAGPRPTARDSPAASGPRPATAQRPAVHGPRRPSGPEARWPSPEFPQFFLSRGKSTYMYKSASGLGVQNGPLFEFVYHLII